MRLAWLWLLLWAASARAATPVNVLTWWGYLDAGVLAPVERGCGVKVAFDEYVSNDEFLRRFRRGKGGYDVAVFSNTIYPLVRKDFAPGASLGGPAAGYLPGVRRLEEKSRLEPNAAIFLLSLTGFLWNKDNISIGPKDTIHDLFSKGKPGLVALIDDYAELVALLRAAKLIPAKDPLPADVVKALRSIRGRNRFLITNTLDNIVTKSDFVFGYAWHGNAFEFLRGRENLAFLMHPRLSYVSLDLVGAASAKPEALCVAKALASASFLNALEEKTSYFSPYRNAALAKANPRAAALKEEMLAVMDTLPFLTDVNPSVLRHVDLDWMRTKLAIGKSGE